MFKMMTLRTYAGPDGEWPHQRLSAARQTTPRPDVVSTDARHVSASGIRIPEHSPKSYNPLG